MFWIVSVACTWSNVPWNDLGLTECIWLDVMLCVVCRSEILDCLCWRWWIVFVADAYIFSLSVALDFTSFYGRFCIFLDAIPFLNGAKMSNRGLLHADTCLFEPQTTRR